MITTLATIVRPSVTTDRAALLAVGPTQALLAERR
jgi:hypothetical protein